MLKGKIVYTVVESVRDDSICGYELNINPFENEEEANEYCKELMDKHLKDYEGIDIGYPI